MCYYSLVGLEHLSRFGLLDRHIEFGSPQLYDSPASHRVSFENHYAPRSPNHVSPSLLAAGQNGMLLAGEPYLHVLVSATSCLARLSPRPQTRSCCCPSFLVVVCEVLVRNAN